MQAQLRSCQFQTTPIKLYIALFMNGRLNTLLDTNLEIVPNRNTKRFACTVLFLRILHFRSFISSSTN